LQETEAVLAYSLDDYVKKRRMRMRKQIFAAAVLVCLLVTGCSNKEAYDSEEALKRGDVVSSALGLKNKERLVRFQKHLASKQKDKIRITGYTIEGDPIFYDLNYNGKTIEYTYDPTHDQYGASPVETGSCTDLIEKLGHSDQIEYALSGCGQTLERHLFNAKK